MTETFGNLKTRIQREVIRPDAENVAPIEDAIVSAIRYYEHLRMWFVEARSNLTVNDGDSQVSLPSNFKAVSTMKLIDSTGTVYGDQTGFKGVNLVDLEDGQYISPLKDERPTKWAIQGSTIYLDTTADAAYTIALIYYKKDSAYPSADGDTSIWFGDESLDMIRYQALNIFYRDFLHNSEKAAEYSALADQQQARLESENTKRKGRLRLKLYS